MKLERMNIGSSPSAADMVFDRLRRSIVSGEFADGQPLRQEEIARHFNTSRIPVREALSRLEQHGLARIRRFHGYTVASLSRRQVEEICAFRALIEAEVIAMAVEKSSDATLELARKCCQAFSEEKDSLRWNERNRDFHYTLYRESGMQYHLAAIQGALDKTERYLIDQLTKMDGMERARMEHLEILEACVARDARAASSLTREHILGACRRFYAALDRGERD